MRAAVVKDGMVVNVLEVEGEETPLWVLCPEEVGIGWSYDGTTFLPPPEPPPPEELPA